MARQNINLGTSANDGTGDKLRVAFDKINDNFVELYEQGDKGAKGDKGEPAVGGSGAQGAQGVAGDKGATGAQGVQGEVGTKGDKGDVGVQGAVGSAGAQGDAGTKGDKGDIGAQGSAGSTGAQGDAGTKGDKGEPGTGGGNADLGDLQVIATTLDIANTTNSSIINIGSGPAKLTMQLDPNSDAYLKLQANTTGSDTFYESGDYTSGTYTAGGSGGTISFSGANNIQNFLNNLNTPATIVSLTINGTDTVLYDGASYGGGSVTLNTTTPPTVDPTTVTSIQFNIVYENKFLIDRDEGDYGIYIGDHNFDIRSIRDIRLYAGDDFSIESNDGFDLRNRSTDGSIRLITDYNNAQHQLEFHANGALQTAANGVYTTKIQSGSEYAALNLGFTDDLTSNGKHLQLRAGDDPAHIHLDAGDLSAYDQYWGNDSKYVKLDRAGNVVIQAYDSNTAAANAWTYTPYGDLKLPANSVINFGQGSGTLGIPAANGANDRIRLWDFEGGGSGYNYAIGAEGNHMWFTMDVNNGTGGFKFYSRDTQIFKIRDDGALIFQDNTVQNTAFTGTAGPQGEQGAQGVQGAVGAQGAQGAQGVQGSMGIAWVSVPTSNTANGTAGDAAYDANGDLYICVTTNTWSKITGTLSW